MTPKECREYLAVRARVQSYASGKIYSGWVDSLDADIVGIALNNDPSLADREKCHVEIHGETSRLMFEAAFERKVKPIQANVSALPEWVQQSLAQGSQNRIAVFRAVGAMRVTEPVESFRKRITGEYVTLTYAGSENECILSDISTEGLGLECQLQLPKGGQVELRYHAVTSVIELFGEVCSCRMSNSVPGYYRCGLNVHPRDRVESGKWAQLFNTGVIA